MRNLRYGNFISVVLLDEGQNILNVAVVFYVRFGVDTLENFDEQLFEIQLIVHPEILIRFSVLVVVEQGEKFPENALYVLNVGENRHAIQFLKDVFRARDERNKSAVADVQIGRQVGVFIAKFQNHHVRLVLDALNVLYPWTNDHKLIFVDGNRLGLRIIF